MKRTERKHLKQDELAFGLHRLVDFGKKFGRQLAIGGIILAVLVVVYLGLQFLKSQNLKKDDKVISEVLTLREGISKNPENLAKLEKFAGKRRPGRLAQVALSTYWVEQGNLDKAEAAVTQVKESPKDNTYYQAQDLLAQIHFWRTNYDKAIEIYKAIVADSPKDYPLDGVLYRQAEALEKKGQKSEALAVFKKLQSEYGQTYYGYEAGQKISALEAEK